MEEGAATEDGVAVVALEISRRGVCTFWPHWLQCDTMNHYRLRGSVYKRLIDYYGKQENEEFNKKGKDSNKTLQDVNEQKQSRSRRK